MAAIRETSHRVVLVDCPVCDRPLPRVLVDVDVRAGGGQVLWLTVRAQDLDAAWWNAARADHPGCLPEAPRVRGWQ